MKAQVFYEAEKMKLEDAPVPKIGPEEVLVRVEACGICGSDVAYFVVSDHGQAGYADANTALVLEDHIELDGLMVQDGGSYAWIYQETPDRKEAEAIRDAINERWSTGKAYLREEVPASWRVSGSMRYPELFVLPDLHYGVVEKREDLRKLKRGDHGWAPDNKEMHGIFIASGPGITPGRKLGTLDAVDIFSMMLELLGIRDPRQSKE